ncbi:hypothetical protein BC826DRAFT_1177838 [Russula brevipes]|nr:hypothetical protein BC826DRAFT_1177838 [Russula brevipes]
MTGDTDEFGFRRYHQSDVVIRKSNCKAVGWFSGTSDADVCGRKVTIKRYNGEKNLALKQWVRDIKALRNLHHENLPQILGYSDGKAPVPFILLASVQNRDFAQVMRSALATYSLADCAILILKTYREVASAIAHATQQLSLSGQDAHDFVHRATYSVDSDNTVIVGLPPPRETWFCHYHSLEQSMSFLTLQYLRDLRNEKQAAVQANSFQSVASYKKYNQLLALLGSLLPHDRDRPCLSTELEALLDDADRDNAHVLHDLWTLSLEQSRYGPTSIAIAPVGVLAVGDYGYNPGDPLNFRDFIVLGNIQNGENGKEIMRAVSEAHCMMYMDGHDPVSCPVSLSVIPDGSECWHVALPPETTGKVSVSHETRLASVKDALQFLLAHGTSLASRHGIEPQDLIVVTRSERYELYDTSGWLPPASRTRSAIGLGSTTPNTLAPYHQHHARRLQTQPWYTSSLLPGQTLGATSRMSCYTHWPRTHRLCVVVFKLHS